MSRTGAESTEPGGDTRAPAGELRACRGRPDGTQTTKLGVGGLYFQSFKQVSLLPESNSPLAKIAFYLRTNPHYMPHSCEDVEQILL